MQARAAVTGLGILVAPLETAGEAVLRCLDSGDGRVRGLRAYSAAEGLEFVEVEEGRIRAYRTRIKVSFKYDRAGNS